MIGAAFDYDEAFSRHAGLIDPDEQKILRGSTVAIVGMGGVGGVHLTTLARLGIGNFRIIDPDVFNLVNFNRQQGASMGSVGRNKAQVMAEQALAINPDLNLVKFEVPITAGNVSEVIGDADILVDGIDFFAIDERRMIFAEARRRGIWGLTAGPLGFSAAWLSFDPGGMLFDEYFDIVDGMDRMDKLIAFLLGLAPAATHRTYMDLSQADPASGRGPSAGLACQLCAGVVAAQVVRLLLKRGGPEPAPRYHQFDAYRQILKSGRLLGGNGSPWNRLKRRRVRRKLEALGWAIT